MGGEGASRRCRTTSFTGASMVVLAADASRSCAWAAVPTEKAISVLAHRGQLPTSAQHFADKAL